MLMLCFVFIEGNDATHPIKMLKNYIQSIYSKIS
jgi:hypothetical protein